MNKCRSLLFLALILSLSGCAGVRSHFLVDKKDFNGVSFFGVKNLVGDDNALMNPQALAELADPNGLGYLSSCGLNNEYIEAKNKKTVDRAKADRKKKEETALIEKNKQDSAANTKKDKADSALKQVKDELDKAEKELTTASLAQKKAKTSKAIKNADPKVNDAKPSVTEKKTILATANKKASDQLGIELKENNAKYETAIAEAEASEASALADAAQAAAIAKAALNPCKEDHGAPHTQDAGEVAADEEAKSRKNLFKAMYCASFYENSKQHRDMVQWTLMSISDESCLRFKNILKGASTMESATMGSIATIFSGLGTILKPVGTANALSGFSAMTTGIDGQMKDSYLASFASDVIAPAIETEQNKVREAITKRRNEEITSYSMSEAVNDVVRYHGKCTLAEGINAVAADTAKNKIIHTSGIGVKDLDEAMKQLNEVKALSSGFDVDGYKAFITDNINNYLKKMSDQSLKDICTKENMSENTGDCADIATFKTYLGKLNVPALQDIANKIKLHVDLQ